MFRFSALSAALVASFVGFGGTMALVLGAAQSVGATEAQTASWITAICIAVAIETLILTIWFRMPIIAAWSIAGLALVTASTGYSMNEAVGAFVAAGLLTIATGLFRPLMRLVEAIPGAISAGMLGGILLPFVVAGAQAATIDPAFILPLAAGFFVLRTYDAQLAVIGVLFVGIAWALLGGMTEGDITIETSSLAFVVPEISVGSFFGLAVPLYVVTMASQNLPGLAVLRADGYRPPAGPVIAVTGVFSTLTGFLGASSTNLAAVTAAICTGEDAHPDPHKRWVTGIWYGLIYIVFALFGASFVALVTVLPASLIALVLGIALLGPLANSTRIAVAEERDRIPAMTTFAITASGIVFFGIGAAFWGLMLGLAVHFLALAKR
ncbi:benzoate transporter BenE [Oceaniradius stylonematis]|jgi:benzoate membrane transport protein|uniref:Benzoate transporter BenE n=1 Tax=Oceaniradius stylonematis TaxID=2184161 RepID=A0A3A8AA60_9HYPH|nr:benzoate/H(+) symporter BenE family transporter [Oceaniradius stylonematis]RKF07197.1 benzoate transporter BenE [Oceaniradius stylonematis]RNC96537.1 MAG: benzoate transporter BenE [Oricola sp.]